MIWSGVLRTTPNVPVAFLPLVHGQWCHLLSFQYEGPDAQKTRGLHENSNRKAAALAGMGSLIIVAPLGRSPFQYAASATAPHAAGYSEPLELTRLPTTPRKVFWRRRMGRQGSALVADSQPTLDAWC